MFLDTLDVGSKSIKHWGKNILQQIIFQFKSGGLICWSFGHHWQPKIVYLFALFSSPLRDDKTGPCPPFSLSPFFFRPYIHCVGLGCFDTQYCMISMSIMVLKIRTVFYPPVRNDVYSKACSGFVLHGFSFVKFFTILGHF